MKLKLKKRLIQLFELATIYIAILTLIPFLFLLGFIDQPDLPQREIVVITIVIPAISIMWFLAGLLVIKIIGRENLEMLPHARLILGKLFIWVTFVPDMYRKFACRTSKSRRWFLRL